jgi:Uma2 family endonuclease
MPTDYSNERDGRRTIVRVPTKAATLEGFRAWARSQDFPGHGRISFLGQEILIDMSPERLESHNKVKTEITRVLANLNVELDLGNFYSDRTLLSNVTASLSTEPDALFVTWQGLESSRLRPIPTAGAEDFVELEGTPDWVLEIVSPRSVRKDTETLREDYHRAGVPEYWLVDARGEAVIFQIFRHRRNGYVAVAQRGGWRRSQVFGRRFRLERRHDRLGQWQYRLESAT